LEAAQRGAKFRQYLADRGINSHVAGVSSSVDDYFIDGHVTISGPYRAKGNEAPIVYAMDSQYGAIGGELIKRRNTLFTAITRSRAWVRICGFGLGMEILQREFDKLRDNEFRLNFRLPTLEELKLMRTQHRDISPDERRKLSKVEAALSTLLAEEEDETSILIENLPLELREKLLRQLQKKSNE
jgi:superfamily I DNA and RNA helicase